MFRRSTIAAEETPMNSYDDEGQAAEFPSRRNGLPPLPLPKPASRKPLFARFARKQPQQTPPARPMISLNEQTGLLRKRLPELATLFERTQSCDWNDAKFEDIKAYVCCLLSGLAYSTIHELELDGEDRFKLVPADLYQELHRDKIGVDIPVLQHMDLGEPFILYGEYSVIVGVQLNRVLFIAVRGTSKLYDLRWDLDLRKVHVQGGLVHAGFWTAATESLPNLLDEVQKRRSPQSRVYVTGHSLGGAIAAILFKLPELAAFSGYTFGMPRYGSEAAMEVGARSNALHHIIDRLDVVPMLPFRCLGFGEPERRRILDNSTRMSAAMSLVQRIAHTLTPYPVRNHFIDSYRTALAARLS
jgi:hypothetical protein